MPQIVKKTVLAASLAAIALGGAASTPAMARGSWGGGGHAGGYGGGGHAGGYGGYRGGGYGGYYGGYGGWGAGLAGVALGAAIAEDDPYYYPPYYAAPYPAPYYPAYYHWHRVWAPGYGWTWRR